MARRWLRGPMTESSGAQFLRWCRGAIVLLYFYFRYLLDFQYLDQAVSGAFVFDGCEDASGTDGVLVDVSQRFFSASAVFTAGDVNKFLVILDNINEVNCGIYKITNYVDANNVDIDFYSPDNPIAATGLSWWLVDSSAPSSLVGGDTVVFRANHPTSPYEFSVSIYDPLTAHGVISFQLAVDINSWNTGTHTWNTDAKLLRTTYEGVGYRDEVAPSRLYLYGSTDGALVWFWPSRVAGTAQTGGTSFGVLDSVFETTPTRQAIEKVFLFGPTDHNAYVYRNGSSTSGMDYGQMWNAYARDQAYLTRWCGWRDGSQDFFKRAITEPNSRNGADFDGLGIWVQIDADVSFNTVWALLGQLPKDHIWLGACAGIGILTTFGSELYMHWRDGVVTPWPGIRWQ